VRSFPLYGIFSFFKRKSRASGSPTIIETVSPDSKRLKEEEEEPVFQDLARVAFSTSSDPGDEVLSALNMADNLGSKMDEILEKLNQLDSIGCQIKSLHESMDRINQIVKRLECKFNRLKQEVTVAAQETNSLKESVKFLNEEVENGKKKLQDSENNTQLELERLRLQLLDYEIYDRRENLLF